MSWPARRTAILALVAVFFAGGATGWVLEDAVDDVHWFDRPGHEGPDGGPASDPLDDDAEEDFLESLGLTAAQRETIDAVLDRREDHLESYWKTRLPDLQAVIDSSRNDVRAVLSPEQRAAYDRWLGADRNPTQP